MKTTRRQFPSVILAAITLSTLAAQLPNTLLHSIPAPPVGVQSGAGLSSSVAVDGTYVVVGAPFDDTWEVDSGMVKVFDSASGKLLYSLPNPNPAGLDKFGVSVAISGMRLMVGAPYDDVGAGGGGTAYFYDLSSSTPLVPVATLSNPNPAMFDRFGISVAISGTRAVVAAAGGGTYVYDLASATPTAPVTMLNDLRANSVAIDGMRVVVGVPYEDTITFNDGNAYVYDLASDTPSLPVATLNGTATAVHADHFGWSVAISGALVVVGTKPDFPESATAGNVHVYDISSTTPTVPVSRLSNPGPVLSDHFGCSVAAAGTRVVVGANGADTGADDAGSAYVYDFSGGPPTAPLITLHNPSPAVGDEFGGSMAISAMLLVIGAPGDDTGAFNAGSAYVYDLGSSTPGVPVATLNSPGPAAMDSFGGSVATSGTRIVVGGGGFDTRVFVYDLSGAAPTVPVAALKNPSATEYDRFGWSVAIDGTRVVVGAIGDATGADGAGSAYVYDLGGETPNVPVVTFHNPTPSEYEYFGHSVAISGSRVVVGVPYEETETAAAGSAYVYDLNSGVPTVPIAVLNNPTPALDDHFGCSVAISGGLVVVAASEDDRGASNAGSACVYNLDGGTPTVPVATLSNPGPATADRFRFTTSVAISGTRVVVGASGAGTGAPGAGTAYVYDLSGGTPTMPIATLNNPSPAEYETFGYSVAISGSRVLVGADGDNTGADAAGSAYLYDLSSPTPTVPVATLNNPDPAPTDRFGWSVAIDGTMVAVGVPGKNSPQADKGLICVYGPSPTDADSDGLPDSWELSYWPTTAGHGPSDDFDHDGTAELLELAFGLNPTLADAGGLPSVTDEGGYLTMTLTKHTGVTYEVQSAGTLLPALPDSFSSATTMVRMDDTTTLKVRDTVRIGSASARFLRAKVTAAP